MLMDDTD
jgi:alpha-amylase